MTDASTGRRAKRSDPAQNATERWFIRRGLPHAIDHYSATKDVFTRAAPFLSLILFVELFGTFGDRFSGVAQAAAFIGGLGLVLAAFAALNLVRGRRPFALPDAIAVPELCLFVIVPALLPALFSAQPWTRGLAVVLFNLVILGIAYVVASYGLIPMVRVGATQSLRSRRRVVQLIARGLPLQLLLTVFVFLNAEAWQVVTELTPAFYTILIGTIFVFSATVTILQAPRELAGLVHFQSWAEVHAIAGCTDAPVRVSDGIPETEPPGIETYDRLEQVNVGLLMVMGQVVQTTVFAIGVFGFYVAFGVLAVRETTILQWTTVGVIEGIVGPSAFLDGEIVLTWTHLGMAGLIAAFSALQLAVANVTDSTYREEFFDTVAADVRNVLAVRAIYRCRSG